MGDSPDQDETRSRESTSSDVHRPSDLESNEFRLSEEAQHAIEERYELLHLLGHGGMGLVYKARDRVSGDVIALKVINPGIASSSHVIERFKAELRLARKITHKNVCRVYDLSQFGNIHALSMEYVEGETLRQILRRNETLSLRHGLKLIRQVIDALDEAHRQEVVHRDLKPENIMVANDSTVKVMDFGLARSLADDTSATVAGVVLGTPAYMSPEQAAGKAADRRSDIYALGLIVYEMFTGRRAFDAETSVGLVAKHIHETPVPPRNFEPDLPHHIEAAILRCLEKAPKKRFNSVRELETALITRGALDLRSPIPLGPAEFPTRLTSWNWRDWMLVTAGILAILVFVGMFDLVFPYHNFQLEISQDEAVDKSRRIVRNYLPELTDYEALTIAGFADQLSEYPGRRSSLGLGKMQEEYKVLAKSWNVRMFQRGRDIYSADLEYDVKGRLVDMVLQRPLGGPDMKASTPDEIIEFSRQCVKDIFGLDVSGVQPSEETTGPPKIMAPSRLLPRAPEGVPHIVWILPGDIPGTKKYVIIGANRGRLYSASVGPGNTAPHFWELDELEKDQQKRLLGLGCVALYALFAIFLSVVRRLYLRTEPVVLAISVLNSLCLAYVLVPTIGGVDEGNNKEWIVSFTVFFVVMLGLSYLAVASTHDYFVRTFPTLAKSFINLIQLRLREQVIGFSMLRGCALGCLFLSGHVLILWLLGKFRLGAPSTTWLKLSELSQSYAFSYVLLAVTTTIVAVWLLLAFPLSLLQRMGVRVYTQLIFVGIVWITTIWTLSGAAVQPTWLQCLLAGLQGTFFAFIILNWDWLSCATAIFTAEIWLLNYPTYRIFAKIDGLLHYGFGLLPWFLVVLVSILIALRSRIIAAWRSLKVIID
jgi:serine/threonine protein kinase